MAVDVGFDVGGAADGAGDDVADGGVVGLFSGELAGAHLLLDVGVVVSELVEGVMTEAITAAISDVCEPDVAPGAAGSVVGRGFEEERDQGGAHAAEAAALAGLGEDAGVSATDGLGHALLGRSGVLGSGDEGGDEGVGCESTGDLSTGDSADAVADDEGSVLGRGGAGVLVVATDEAGVGEHGGSVWGGLHGESWGQRAGEEAFRRKPYTLAGLEAQKYL